MIAFLNYRKPVSRILFPILRQAQDGMAIIYLAVTLLQQSCCLPFSSDEQSSNADIRGIAAHKVYPKLLLPTIPVSSYLTFSPLSAKGGR